MRELAATLLVHPPYLLTEQMRNRQNSKLREALCRRYIDRISHNDLLKDARR